MSLYAFIPLLTGQVSQNKLNLDLLAAQPLGISRDINSFPSLNGLAGRPRGDGTSSGIDALLALVGDGEEPSAKPGKLIPREIEGGKVFVLDDFENPDLSSNWTLTGDSFRSGRSFDGATYNQRTQDPSAQIKGFEGKQFAFSFEGRNSNIGKAVSKEFVIDWDQISFDIMGGTSNSTRLELVLVNDSGTEQAVRTATGDGTLNFTRKNWNVKSYKGKTAKLVITDDSAAASYGFIGVDNIRGEGELVSGAPVSTTPALTAGIPSFLRNRFLVAYSHEKRSEKNFGSDYLMDSLGVSRLKLLEIQQSIMSRMITPDFNHRSSETLLDLSVRIRGVAEKIVTDSLPASSKPSEDLKVFATVFAIIEWVRTHVKYDQALVGLTKYPHGPERQRRFDPDEILKMEVPSTVCGGYSWMVSAMAASAGYLHVDKIEGNLRWNQDLTSIQHSWNAVNLPCGVVLYADPTCAAAPLELVRQRSIALPNLQVLATTEEGAGYFLATRFALRRISPTVLNNKKIGSNASLVVDRDLFSDLSMNEWINLTPLRELSQFQPTLDADHFKTWVYTR
jgi:hypothetical protein